MHQELYHVTQRAGLPVEIQQTLLESERGTWERHPRFRGKAEFFLNFHKFLLEGSARLKREIEDMLVYPSSLDTRSQRWRRMEALSDVIAHRAHGHHTIEDQFYFPQFVRILPRLEKAIDLLDQDHKILSPLLAELEDRTLLRSAHGDLSSKLGLFHQRVGELEKVLKRHLHDEEEVIIPIFLLS